MIPHRGKISLRKPGTWEEENRSHNYICPEGGKRGKRERQERMQEGASEQSTLEGLLINPEKKKKNERLTNQARLRVQSEEDVKGGGQGA